MHKHQSRYLKLQSFIPIFLSCLLLGLVSIASAQPVSNSPVIGNDDHEFVFMGRCDSGEIWRLKAYQKSIDGVFHSFYDYEGPAGTGSVQTQTSPKILAARICRALAEIRSDF